MSARLVNRRGSAWRVVAQTALTALTLACGSASSAVADSGQRIALVIGNSAYRNSPLANPINDSKAMATSLGKLGFTVISLQNASQQQMFDAVRKFGDSLHGGVGLFYFAGHGVQVKGHNYLVPVDAAIEREDEVPFKAFDVNAVLEKMESAKNPLNIIILDACRNNPFARTSRSASSGLAQMDAPSGSIVAFATSPGAEAADGASGNGLYTSYLLQNMATPGLTVEDVFKRTRVSVKQESQGRQIPWESTSLEGDFSFAPGAAGAPSAASARNAKADDAEVWSLIASSNSPSAYQAYLERYPNGSHAAQARALVGAPRSVSEAEAAATTPRPSPKSFSFSVEEEKMDRATPEGRLDSFRKSVAIPCAPRQRNASVRLVLTEGVTPGLDPAFRPTLEKRLREAGLKVVNGAADYVLTGTVATQVDRNRHIDLQQISVSAALSLDDPSGKSVSSPMSREESWSGADVNGAYRELVSGQASDVAAQLFADLCRH